MSANMTHSITLLAKDGVSAVFAKMAQSGQASASKIVSSEKQVAASLTQVDTAASKTAATMSKLNAAHAAYGAVLASAVGVLADASRAAAEEEAQLAGLESAINATGASYDVLASAVDRSVAAAMRMSFADDQAVAALNALTTTTGSADKAIANLSLAMDLARGKHMDLETAATVVGKVAAGNTAILTRYAIVIDEGATATEALAALQQRFSGQAQTYADSQVGAATRIKNSFDDLLESVGGSSEELQSLLLLLPGLSSGFSLLGGAVGGLSKSLAGMTGGVGLGGVASLLNPVGLGLTAVAAAGGLVAKQWMDQQAANQKLTDSFETLEQALVSFTAAQRVAAAGIDFDVSFEKQAKALFEQSEFAQEAADNAGVPGPMFKAAVLDAQEMAEANNLLASSLRDVDDASRDLAVESFARLRQEWQDGAATGDDVLAVLRESADMLDEQGDGAKYAQAWWAALVEKYASGEYTAAQLAERLVYLNDHMDENVAHVIELAGATKSLNELMGITVIGARDLSGVVSGLRGAAQEVEAIKASIDGAIRSTATVSLSGIASGLNDPTESQGQLDKFRQANQAKADADEERKRKQEEVNAAIEEEARAREAVRDVLDRQIEAERDYAAEVKQNERDLASSRRQAAQDLNQELRQLTAERVDAERSAAQQIRDLDAQRRDIAVQIEQQLADLARQRADIEANVAEQARAAQEQWQEAVANIADQQADVRAELARTTEEARRAWQAVNADILAQQREITAELKAAIADIRRESGREQDDLRRDIAYAEEDLKNAQGDPYDAGAVASASRRLEELREELARSKEDERRTRKEAQQQAKEERAALDERGREAAEAFRDRVADAQADAASKLADLDRQRQDALKERADAEAKAAAAAAKQMEDLAQREQQIREDAAEQYQDLEQQKRIAARDTARELQVLARQTAAAQEKADKEALAIHRAAAREAKQADVDYLENVLALAEDLAAARSEVDATGGKVGGGGPGDGDYTEAHDERKAARKAERKAARGRALGGPLWDVPHAALGRMVMVGENGPELLINGNLIMPHGASQSRVQAEGDGGVHHHYHFPNARFELKTPDLAREISSQVNQMLRGK